MRMPLEKEEYTRLFRMASMTKAVVSVCALQWLERASSRFNHQLVSGFQSWQTRMSWTQPPERTKSKWRHHREDAPESHVGSQLPFSNYRA